MTRKSLIDLNTLALTYFIRSLYADRHVYTYLRGRLSEHCIEMFRLGYAPAHGLVKFLSENGVNLKDAEALGLVGANEDGSYFDVFSNRIIIPIVYAGLLVGFGGRTYQNKSAIKYINSRTSLIYKKGEMLFGLWHSRKYIQEKKIAIVLEGYFDWLRLFSGGVKNVVAACGTSLSDMHCTSMKRYTRNVGIMFDGDAVGYKRMKDALLLIQKNNMVAYSICLPDKLDPDEYLDQYGLDAMNALIAESICKKGG